MGDANTNRLRKNGCELCLLQDQWGAVMPRVQRAREGNCWQSQRGWQDGFSKAQQAMPRVHNAELTRRPWATKGRGIPGGLEYSLQYFTPPGNHREWFWPMFLIVLGVVFRCQRIVGILQWQAYVPDWFGKDFFNITYRYVHTNVLNLMHKKNSLSSVLSWTLKSSVLTTLNWTNSYMCWNLLNLPLLDFPKYEK